MSTEASGKKEIRTHFMSHVNPQEAKLHSHSTALTCAQFWGLPWWLRWWRIHLQHRRPGFYPWVQKVPWRMEWLPTPEFLPGESKDRGWTPQGLKESDTTERLTLSLDTSQLWTWAVFFWAIPTNYAFCITHHLPSVLCPAFGSPVEYLDSILSWFHGSFFFSGTN